MDISEPDECDQRSHYSVLINDRPGRFTARRNTITTINIMLIRGRDICARASCAR